jgi:hypothetical protein
MSWIQEKAGTHGGTGDLDDPTDGATLEGEVLLVRGWCLFEDSRLARVEVVIDGERVGLARPYVPRGDVAQHFDLPDGPMSGFEMLVDWSGRPRDGESMVTVEAASLDGRLWRSKTHRFRWSVLDDEIPARAELLVHRSMEATEQTRVRGDRLMVFTHDLSYGGGQLWLFELLRQLALGPSLECMVVAPADGPMRHMLEDLGIQVHVTAPCRVDDVEAYEGRVRELAAFVRANGAGAVLVNTLGMFCAIDAAARAGVPSAWAIHESFEPAIYRYICWAAMHPHMKARFEQCFRATHTLIFEARQTAELFDGLCARERCVVIDYGVDIEAIDEYRRTLDRDALRAAWGFGDGDLVIVVMGVFEGRKAQAAVVAAFDELASVHPQLRLVLVGYHKSPYAEALRDHIARCRLRERIKLVPVTPEVYPWYAAADLFVCASDIESMPRSILEAMAFELPVVSTDAFGIADLIDDCRTGWLTRPRDLEGLVGLLHSVLRGPESERIATGRRARAAVLHRHEGAGYGQIVARALNALMDDPAADLTAMWSASEVRELVR